MYLLRSEESPGNVLMSFRGQGRLDDGSLPSTQVITVILMNKLIYVCYGKPPSPVSIYYHPQRRNIQGNTVGPSAATIVRACREELSAQHTSNDKLAIVTEATSQAIVGHTPAPWTCKGGYWNGRGNVPPPARHIACACVHILFEILLGLLLVSTFSTYRGSVFQIDSPSWAFDNYTAQRQGSQWSGLSS